MSEAPDRQPDKDMIDAVAADIEQLNKLIPRYKIEEKIGQGGQATVYRAIQKSNKRQVALKVLLSHGLFSIHSKQGKRIEREISALSSVNHPNIVQIYDSGHVRGMPWFAMEYVEGYNLIEYAEIHELSQQELVELFSKITHAVGAAHYMGIVHRDLKPSNILVDGMGVPHIVDFGLVTDAIEDVTQDTATSEIVGTLHYSSPEQLVSKRLDARSDVYTLGVLLYQLMTNGKFPYPADVPTPDLMRNIMAEDPKRVPGIPRDFWHIILKAMAKDRERRYEDAGTLTDDLRRWLQGEPIMARANSPMYMLSKSLRRHKAATAIGLLALALIGLGAFSWAESWYYKQLSRNAQLALDSGGHLHLANVLRDDGRVELAMQSFKDAIEITRLSANDDPVVLSIRYRALHRLAWQHYVDGDLEAADRYTEEAVKLAERMSREHSSDDKWKKHLAFSHILRGRGSAAKKEWYDVVQEFSAALTLISKIELRKDSAFCMRWIARGLYETGDYKNAHDTYRASQLISETLHQEEPGTAEHIIDIAQCDNWMARCLVKSDSQESLLRAQSILKKAMHSLEQLGESHGLKGMSALLVENLRWDLDQVEKRIQGSPASSTSPG